MITDITTFKKNITKINKYKNHRRVLVDSLTDGYDCKYFLTLETDLWEQNHQDEFYTIFEIKSNNKKTLKKAANELAKIYGFKIDWSI